MKSDKVSTKLDLAPNPWKYFLPSEHPGIKDINGDSILDPGCSILNNQANRTCQVVIEYRASHIEYLGMVSSRRQLGDIEKQ